MTLFIFPSKFEGLGIVAIEAQATGLPTLCSEFIPQETNITDVISYISLENEDEWINKINEVRSKKINRSEYMQIVTDAGYDAKKSAEILENYYRGII